MSSLNKDQLNMDSGSGDSDCGTTLKRGAEALLNAVKKDPTLASRPSLLFHLISKVRKIIHFFFAKKLGPSKSKYSCFA